MAEVFIAYKRADRARIEPLLALLRGDGVDVWLDDYLDAARDWRPQVEAQIDSALVVLACWTRGACLSPFVIEEAQRGAARGILTSVRLDRVAATPLFAPPDADLSAWTGNVDHPGLAALRDALETRIGRSLSRQRICQTMY